VTCPCGKDCRERSAECHSRCERYLAYEREKHAEYARKAARGDRNGKTCGMERMGRESARKEREGRRHWR